jgi:hypothetical protein
LSSGRDEPARLYFGDGQQIQAMEDHVKKMPGKRQNSNCDVVFYLIDQAHQPPKVLAVVAKHE